MFCFLFLAPYCRTTRYEEAFLPKGKKQPRSLRSLGLVSWGRGYFFLGKPRKKRLASLARLIITKIFSNIHLEIATTTEEHHVIRIWDMVADTQFHKFHSRPFGRFIHEYAFLFEKYLECCLSNGINCPNNWFLVLSIKWNSPNNWFWRLEVDWNCPHKLIPEAAHEMYCSRNVMTLLYLSKINCVRIQ